MSNEKDSEIDHKNPSKSVKRVRFSDEVQNLSFDVSDESNSLENESDKLNLIIDNSDTESDNTHIEDTAEENNGAFKESSTDTNSDSSVNEENANELENFEDIDNSHSDELNRNDCSENNGPDECSESSPCTMPPTAQDYEIDAHVNDLITETKLMTISPLSSPESNNLPVFEKESLDFSEQISIQSQNDIENIVSGDYFETNLPVQQDMFDVHMNELINETKLMTITSLHNNNIHEKDSSCLSSCEISQENVVNDFFDNAEQKVINLNMSRKRSVKGDFVEKQTSQINDILSKKDIDLNSASIITAVFNAWCEVKNKNSDLCVQNDPNPPAADKSKVTSKSAPGKTFDAWKKTKKKSKTKYKNVEHTSQQASSKVDPEESKMAFEAWKKKKDQMLKEVVIEKRRKEERERVKSLLNERVRKSDAQSAYSAWNAHKSFTMKLEKKKNLWLQQREKEKLYQKMNKRDAAKKRYEEWLINKVYSDKSDSVSMIEDRPPWFPPGRADNFI